MTRCSCTAEIMISGYDDDDDDAQRTWHRWLEPRTPSNETEAATAAAGGGGGGSGVGDGDGVMLTMRVPLGGVGRPGYDCGSLYSECVGGGDNGNMCLFTKLKYNF